ncbi:MAG: T9SS type A sorting domain-containing protein [Flavobacteriales bacterium]|nr:T9SS type A sorting domain-containing protein [Flavobacteriales bacterium]
MNLARLLGCFLTALALSPGFCQLGVQQAEYFWDTDPGPGNGTPMSAADGAFNNVIEAIMAQAPLPSPVGAHRLGVRSKDQDGAWGPLFSIVVDIWPNFTTWPDVHLQNAEYFFDDDPGLGQGTPMLSADGAFDNVIETVRGAAIPPVQEGIHVLRMRAQDLQGEWGPVFSVVVNVDTTISDHVRVDESPQRNAMSIYPNPSEIGRSVTIDLGRSEDHVSLSLMDGNGRLVHTQQVATAARILLPLNDLAPGVYALRVQCAAWTEKRKLILR